MPIQASKLMNRPIRVRSRYGSLQLRVLNLNDLIFLEDLQSSELAPREYVVRIIHNQLNFPELDVETVRGWRNGLLHRAAKRWLKYGFLQHKADVGRKLYFEDFVHIVEKYKGEEQKRQRELMEGVIKSFALPKLTLGHPFTSYFTNQVAPALQTFSMSIIQAAVESMRPSIELIQGAFTGIALGVTQNAAANFVDTFGVVQKNLAGFAVSQFPQLAVGQLFQQLPDLSDLFVEWGRIQRADKALEESGYGFAFTLLDRTFVASFAEIDGRVRGAAITNSLLAQTRSTEFEEELRTTVQGSRILRRRWKVIERALKAHKERDYLVSVTLLMPQLEGVVADALILKSLVALRGHTLYLKDVDGKVKMNKGKPERVKGLVQLVEKSEYRDHPVLWRAADFLTESFAPERNLILHGRKTSYGTAKASTQLFLLVLT